jgi:hypothetical protein
MTKDDRNLYAPLRKPEDFDLTWPLLDHEMPGKQPTACNKNCVQGRACDCVPAVDVDCKDAADQYEGAGAVVVPAVVAFALACAALIAFIGGYL